MEEQTKQEKYEAVLHNLHKSIEREKALRAELEQLRKARGEYVYPVCPNCLCVVETGDSKKTEPVAWMIECKEVFTGWWSGGKLDCRFFDKDPNKGIRFPTKESAESVIRNIGSSCMIATDHIWLSNPTPEQVEQLKAEIEKWQKERDYVAQQLDYAEIGKRNAVEKVERQAALLKQCKEALHFTNMNGFCAEESCHKMEEALAALESYERGEV